MLDLFEAVGLELAMLLPIANPLTTVAVLIGLSHGMSEGERNRQALRASCYVFAIMLVAFYAGQMVMNTFGISIPGLRIAGGMIVAFIGFRMLFPEHRPEKMPEVEQRAEELQQRRITDIAFIPLAMPSTAGPGTIALIVSAEAVAKEDAPFASWVMALAPPLAFLLVSVILLLSLRSAGNIIRVLGNSGVEAISRLMGFLLVCVGVQFTINGVLEVAEQLRLGA